MGQRTARRGGADSPPLRTVVGTELTRLRRGFVGWYATLLPIVVGVPLYVGSVFSPEGATGRTWDVFSNVTLEFWGVLIPVTAALFCALSVRADADAQRIMYSYAVPRWRYHLGKFGAIMALQVFSASVLVLVLLGGAAITGQTGSAIGMILAASYLPVLAGAAATAIDLAVAELAGFGPTMALGVLGMLAGALVSDKTIWFVIPWAWSMRVILPLAGIGPNGIPLPPLSPLADTGPLYVALVLSVVVGAVAAALGSVQATRKEI